MDEDSRLLSLAWSDFDRLNDERQQVPSSTAVVVSVRNGRRYTRQELDEDGRRAMQEVRKWREAVGFSYHDEPERGMKAVDWMHVCDVEKKGCSRLKRYVYETLEGYLLVGCVRSGQVHVCGASLNGLVDMAEASATRDGRFACDADDVRGVLRTYEVCRGPLRFLPICPRLVQQAGQLICPLSGCVVSHNLVSNDGLTNEESAEIRKRSDLAGGGGGGVRPRRGRSIVMATSSRNSRHEPAKSDRYAHARVYDYQNNGDQQNDLLPTTWTFMFQPQEEPLVHVAFGYVARDDDDHDDDPRKKKKKMEKKAVKGDQPIEHLRMMFSTTTTTSKRSSSSSTSSSSCERRRKRSDIIEKPSVFSSSSRRRRHHHHHQVVVDTDDDVDIQTRDRVMTVINEMMSDSNRYDLLATFFLVHVYNNDGSVAVIDSACLLGALSSNGATTTTEAQSQRHVRARRILVKFASIVSRLVEEYGEFVFAAAETGVAERMDVMLKHMKTIFSHPSAFVGEMFNMCNTIIGPGSVETRERLTKRRLNTAHAEGFAAVRRYYEQCQERGEMPLAMVGDACYAQALRAQRYLQPFDLRAYSMREDHYLTIACHLWAVMHYRRLDLMPRSRVPHHARRHILGVLYTLRQHEYSFPKADVTFWTAADAYLFRYLPEKSDLTEFVVNNRCFGLFDFIAFDRMLVEYERTKKTTINRHQQQPATTASGKSSASSASSSVRRPSAHDVTDGMNELNKLVLQSIAYNESVVKLCSYFVKDCIDELFNL